MKYVAEHSGRNIFNEPHSIYAFPNGLKGQRCRQRRLQLCRRLEGWTHSLFGAPRTVMRDKVEETLDAVAAIKLTEHNVQDPMEAIFKSIKETEDAKISVFPFRAAYFALRQNAGRRAIGRESANMRADSIPMSRRSSILQSARAAPQHGLRARCARQLWLTRHRRLARGSVLRSTLRAKNFQSQRRTRSL